MIARDAPVALLIGDYDFAIVDLRARAVLSRIDRRASPENIAIDDSGKLIAVGTSGGALLMRLDSAELRGRLCAEKGRNLDNAEWSKYLPGESWKPVCPNWD
jgi:hypothetical protein